MVTVDLRADWPLRIRVSRSAIGSVMLIVSLLPARLAEPRNLAAHRDFSNLHSRQPELAIHAARAAGDGTTVAVTARAGIARLGLQADLRGRALFRRRFRTADGFLEL